MKGFPQSSSKKQRILNLLRSTKDALNVEEIAASTMLSTSATRNYLELLVESNKVSKTFQDRCVVGRPKVLYRAIISDSTPTFEASYQFLASIFVNYFSSALENGGEKAEIIGQEWGAFLVTKPLPFQSFNYSQSLELLRKTFEEMGFSPQIQSNEMSLLNCPFQDIAINNPEIICRLHLGMIKGALKAMGDTVQVSDLIPFTKDGICKAKFK